MSPRCKSKSELRDPFRVVAVVRCMLFKGHDGGHLFAQSWDDDSGPVSERPEQ